MDLTPEEYAMICRRAGSVEGTRPVVPPVPPPGIYWIRMTRVQLAYWFDRTGKRLDHPEHNDIYNVYTWDGAPEGNWFLVQVENERGEFLVIGDDQSGYWETKMEVVSTLGPRVEEPE